MTKDTNKIKLLVLWDILCKNTDENHAMNADEIREELEKRGISVMRKVVATDIAALNNFGYEVLSYKKKYYYYYVVNRPLETAEVVMLADVIKASKLTSTQKNIMIEKLSGTLCSHQAENLSKHIISLDKGRKGSSSLIYNVDAIERGIEENKQISFLYFDYDEKHKKVYRKNGDRYNVNPAFMVWNRDNYYMLCFSNGHDDSRNGKNKRVWRCLNRLEHGTEFCYDSITIDDEALKQAICRGINKAITDRQDVMSLILSNLSYAVTGQDDTLEMYAIEKQIASLNKIMDETMELATNSTGDGKRFMEEIKSLSEQIVVLREQLEAVQGRLKSNERVSEEIENIKNYLSSDNADFTEYNDTMVRRLVEYIRVMKDKTIIIVLKGGLQIEEKLEQI